MGCGQSQNREVEDSRQVKKKSKDEKKRSILQQKNEIKVDQNDHQDLQEAQKIMGGTQKIESQETFIKPQKQDKTNIATQIVSKENFTEFQKKQNAIKAGEKYTDSEEFPPEQKSLSRKLSYMPESESYEWKRATEIYPDKNVNIFQGDIEPNDIRQGALGDCYFLSALSVLAEKPNLIKKLFVTKQFNEKGIYATILNIDGCFQEIIIDDLIPTKNGNVVFSHANQKDLDKFGFEIWVILLEKSYAKAFGGYNQIVSGHCGNAIRDLTGAPQDNMPTKEGADKVWDFIISHDQQGHMLTAGTGGDVGPDGKELDNGKGIVSGHAYAILDAQTVQSDGEERLIQVRNPWGTKEWSGDWSDKSIKWTEELKQKLKFTDEDDGIFWIKVEDFINEFEDVNTNFVNEDYFYNSKKLIFKDQTMAIIKFNVKNNDTHAYIQINQKDRRHFEEQDNYKYSHAKIIICKGDFTQYIGDKSSAGRNITVEGVFQKGTYLAFVEMGWVQDNQGLDGVTISAYSSDMVQICEDYDYLQDEDLTLLDKMLICQPPQNQEKIKRYEDDTDIIRYQGEAGGYVYFQYINQSKTGSTLKEQVQMDDIQHLQITTPYDNSQLFEIEVQPNQAKVVKYRVQPDGQGSYSYSILYSSQIILSEEVLLQRVVAHSKDNRQQRADWQVYCTTYQYSQGYILYFENNIADKVYEERSRFELDNLKIVMQDGEEKGNELSIEVQPNSTLFFKLLIIDPLHGYSYGSEMSMGLR